MRFYIFSRLISASILILIICNFAFGDNLARGGFGKSAVSAEDSIDHAKGNADVEYITGSFSIAVPMDMPVKFVASIGFETAGSDIILENMSPSWEHQYNYEYLDEPEDFGYKPPGSFKDFHGFKYRTPSRVNRNKDIARSSRYSDIFHAFNYNSRYYTFKTSADFVTPPVYDVTVLTSFAPAFWVEKGKANPLESERNFSMSYRCHVNFSKSRLLLSSGVSGICFLRDTDIIGNDLNYMNYDLNTGVRLIEYTYLSFLMRYPVTEELEKITEPNYTLLIIREL